MAERPRILILEDKKVATAASHFRDELMNAGFAVTAGPIPTKASTELIAPLTNRTMGLVVMLDSTSLTTEEPMTWIYGLIDRVRHSGYPTGLMVQFPEAGLGLKGSEFGSAEIVSTFTEGDPWQPTPQIVQFFSDRLRRTAIDLTLHPPVERPEPDDAVMIGSEIESLLTWAERFVADEANPEDLRDEVDTRRRQLRDELRLIEQGKGRSGVLTGISGALLDLVRPEPAEEGLGAALDEVADGVVALGRAASDDERVEAGEEVVAALGHVGEEVAEVIEANGWDDLKASMWRTAGTWVEEDSRAHLNAFLVALRERALPAGGGVVAGTAVQQLMGGPPWLAVTIVAAGLLRSLFPWIFPSRTPPEEQG